MTCTPARAPSLPLVPGGKQLLLVGGQLRSQEQGARQTAVLSLDTLT